VLLLLLALLLPLLPVGSSERASAVRCIRTNLLSHSNALNALRKPARVGGRVRFGLAAF